MCRLAEDERIDGEPQCDQRRVVPSPRPHGQEGQRRARPARPRAPRIAVRRKYRTPNTRHGCPPAGVLRSGRHGFESALMARVLRRIAHRSIRVTEVASHPKHVPPNSHRRFNSAPRRRDDCADSWFFPVCREGPKSREFGKAGGKRTRFPQLDDSESCCVHAPAPGESRGRSHQDRPVESSQ